MYFYVPTYYLLGATVAAMEAGGKGGGVSPKLKFGRLDTIGVCGDASADTGIVIGAKTFTR